MKTPLIGLLGAVFLASTALSAPVAEPADCPATHIEARSHGFHGYDTDSGEEIHKNLQAPPSPPDYDNKMTMATSAPGANGATDIFLVHHAKGCKDAPNGKRDWITYRNKDRWIGLGKKHKSKYHKLEPPPNDLKELEPRSIEARNKHYKHGYDTDNEEQRFWDRLWMMNAPQDPNVGKNEVNMAPETGLNDRHKEPPTQRSLEARNKHYKHGYDTDNEEQRFWNRLWMMNAPQDPNVGKNEVNMAPETGRNSRNQEPPPPPMVEKREPSTDGPRIAGEMIPAVQNEKRDPEPRHYKTMTVTKSLDLAARAERTASPNEPHDPLKKTWVPIFVDRKGEHDGAAAEKRDAQPEPEAEPEAEAEAEAQRNYRFGRVRGGGAAEKRDAQPEPEAEPEAQKSVERHGGMAAAEKRDPDAQRGGRMSGGKGGRGGAAAAEKRDAEPEAQKSVERHGGVAASEKRDAEPEAEPEAQKSVERHGGAAAAAAAEKRDAQRGGRMSGGKGGRGGRPAEKRDAEPEAQKSVERHGGVAAAEKRDALPEAFADPEAQRGGRMSGGKGGRGGRPDKRNAEPEAQKSVERHGGVAAAEKRDALPEAEAEPEAQKSVERHGGVAAAEKREAHPEAQRGGRMSGGKGGRGGRAEKRDANPEVEPEAQKSVERHGGVVAAAAAAAEKRDAHPEAQRGGRMSGGKGGRGGRAEKRDAQPEPTLVSPRGLFCPHNATLHNEKYCKVMHCYKCEGVKERMACYEKRPDAPSLPAYLGTPDPNPQLTELLKQNRDEDKPSGATFPDTTESDTSSQLSTLVARAKSLHPRLFFSKLRDKKHNAKHCKPGSCGLCRGSNAGIACFRAEDGPARGGTNNMTGSTDAPVYNPLTPPADLSSPAPQNVDPANIMYTASSAPPSATGAPLARPVSAGLAAAGLSPPGPASTLTPRALSPRSLDTQSHCCAFHCSGCTGIKSRDSCMSAQENLLAMAAHSPAFPMTSDDATALCSEGSCNYCPDLHSKVACVEAAAIHQHVDYDDPNRGPTHFHPSAIYHERIRTIIARNAGV